MKKVLIVDDNAEFIKIATRILKNAGFDVRSSTRGEDALGVVHYYHPHFILLDLDLYGTEGIELCDHVKRTSETQDVKIIAMVGYRNNNAVRNTCKADVVIQKPFSFKELIEEMHALLDEEQEF